MTAPARASTASTKRAITPAVYGASHRVTRSSLRAATRERRCATASPKSRTPSYDGDCYPLVTYRRDRPMILLGVILMVIGFVAVIPLLWTSGIILVVIGVILALAGMMGYAVGGRRHYYCRPDTGVMKRPEFDGDSGCDPP